MRTNDKCPNDSTFVGNLPAGPTPDSTTQISKTYSSNLFLFVPGKSRITVVELATGKSTFLKVSLFLSGLGT